MNRLGLITILTALTILLSCSTDTVSVNGHWHSSIPGWNSYKTLDIDDSITTWNKYQIEGLLPNTCLRKDPKTGKLYLPFQDTDYSYTDTYSIDNDSLKITLDDFSIKYFKSKIEECELADRYTYSDVNISLSESPTAEDYDQLSYCANMFIGKPKSQELSKEYPDSVFIQVGDVYILLKDIPTYCKRTKDMYLPDETIDLVLHADNSVTELFIGKILENVPPTMTTYRAVKKEGQLGVSKITRD